VLRLAAAARARLHYVSTIGVFPGGPGHLSPVLEDARPTEPERLALGYMRAKWVAEELVAQACDRGLDVSIYRPGTISAHSTSGVFNPDDFVCALIKGCVQLGLAPRVDPLINLAPVDYVSRALVRIAFTAAAPAGKYHLVGPRAVGWDDVVAWIRQLGYRLEETSYAKWRTVLLDRAAATGNALAPLVPLFADHETTDWLRLPPYDDAKTRCALAGSGITCPGVDATLIRRYIEQFVVSGYLARPR
jgi:thioester reductase-like protein